jgi:hypothetical protein
MRSLTIFMGYECRKQPASHKPLKVRGKANRDAPQVDSATYDSWSAIIRYLRFGPYGSADFLLHFGIPTASDESLYCSDSEVAQNWQPTIVGCDGETIWWHSRSGARRYFRTILHARAAAAGLARSWLVGCSEGRCVLYR